jgi:hypothetical protein
MGAIPSIKSTTREGGSGLEGSSVVPRVTPVVLSTESDAGGCTGSGAVPWIQSLPGEVSISVSNWSAAPTLMSSRSISARICLGDAAGVTTNSSFARTTIVSRQLRASTAAVRLASLALNLARSVTRRAAVVASFISNTRRAMDIAVAVVASFIEAAVVAVAVTSSKSWAKVIAGAVVVAT